jgi:Ca2+/H+ antiporter
MIYSNGSPIETAAISEVIASEVVGSLLDVVHACECLVGLILAAKANESEATTAIGVPVFDDNLAHAVKGLQTTGEV